jgi:hypothetical protein
MRKILLSFLSVYETLPIDTDRIPILMRHKKSYTAVDHNLTQMQAYSKNGDKISLQTG